MLCWPLDSNDSTRWHHDIMTFPWLVFEEEKPWLVVGDMYFSMVWPISSMIFRVFFRVHMFETLWLIEAARAVARSGSVFIFTLRCHAAIALEKLRMFFFGQDLSHNEVCKIVCLGVNIQTGQDANLLVFPKQHFSRNSAFGFWLLNQCQSFLVKCWSRTNYI